VSAYVALLRGINVGGKNLIRMPALKACFEENGFEDVATYIQSGNVLFSSSETSNAELTDRIEAMLAPKGFGTQPATYRYDVIFLKEPLSAKTAIKAVPPNPAVDAAHTGTGVLYFSRLTAKATASRLGKIVSSPIYQSVTIRNWNTTTKLLSLMDERI